MTTKEISSHTRALRDGKTLWEETGEPVRSDVQIISSEGLQDFSKLQTTAADACIYCGSTGQRSREHVVAYALGGTVTIPKASCRSCQEITQQFETAVLRGPMQMVRYIQELPSRTKHRDVPETVPIVATIDGKDKEIEIPRSEAPILLVFPTFDEPTYLSGEESPLRVNGIATFNYGADPADVARKLEATSIRMTSSDNAPVPFAQTVAKTAYANAYINNQIYRLKNPDDLVEATLHKPDTIGKFVGTIPESYMKREGIVHYIGIHELSNPRVLYSTVQLFAGSGAPTYIVVLGDLK